VRPGIRRAGAQAVVGSAGPPSGRSQRCKGPRVRPSARAQRASSESVFRALHGWVFTMARADEGTEPFSRLARDFDWPLTFTKAWIGRTRCWTASPRDDVLRAGPPQTHYSPDEPRRRSHSWVSGSVLRPQVGHQSRHAAGQPVAPSARAFAHDDMD
jgi:hypothetical protein